MYYLSLLSHDFSEDSQVQNVKQFCQNNTTKNILAYPNLITIQINTPYSITKKEKDL